MKTLYATILARTFTVFCVVVILKQPTIADSVYLIERGIRSSEIEPNNSQSKANTLIIGTPVYGASHDRSENSDFFSFTLEKTDMVEIQLESLNLKNDHLTPEISIRIISSTGDLVHDGIAGWPGLDRFVANGAMSAGLYYAEIYSTADWRPGEPNLSYKLNISSTSSVTNQTNQDSTQVAFQGWNYHAWPWVYSDADKDWLYYASTVNGWAAWRRKDNKWYGFNATTNTWSAY
jgi:hypothetical protein